MTFGLPRLRTAQYALIFLVALLSVISYTRILTQSGQEFKEWLNAGGNYNRLRDVYRTFSVSAQVQRIIPADTSVALSGSVSGIEYIAARYQLYPLKISPDADYLLDLDQDAADFPDFTQKRVLPSGIPVYARDGTTFLPRQRPVTPLLLEIKFLIFIGICFGQACLGEMFLRLFRFPKSAPNKSWRLATGYLAGFLLFTASIWIALFLGVTLSVTKLCAISVFLALLMFLISAWLGPAYPTKPVTAPPAPSGITRCFRGLVIALTVFTSIWIISNPVEDWDTMANWGLKAKVLAHEGSLDLNYTQDVHNVYPILWPLHAAITYTFLGETADEIFLWSSALFFLVFLAQMARGLSSLNIPPVYGTLSILLYFTFFVYKIPTATALPENAFLACLTALIVTLCWWLKDPDQNVYAALSVVWALGLNLLKLEGAVTTAVIIVALLAVRFQRIFTVQTLSLIVPLMLTLLPPVLWVHWTEQTGLSPGVFHLNNSFSMGKGFALLGQNLQHFFLSGEFLILMLVAGFFICFPNKRSWGATERFLLIVTVLLIAFRWTATAGWSQSLILNDSVFQDAAWRLFLHASPALLLVFASRAFNREK